MTIFREKCPTCGELRNFKIVYAHEFSPARYRSHPYFKRNVSVALPGGQRIFVELIQVVYPSFAICEICDTSVIVNIRAAENYVAGWIYKSQSRTIKRFAEYLVEAEGVLPEKDFSIEEMHPKAPEPYSPETLDEPIRREFIALQKIARIEEARSAFLTTARKVLELICKKFDTSGKLVDRIDQLQEQGLITQPIAEWAHQIRIWGNVGAHEEELPTDAEVEEVLAFLKILIEVLFEIPRRIEEMRRSD